MIILDINGAGYGYFIDPTPGSDSAFARGQNGAAAHQVDLLTVVMHEMGHILGINEVVNRPGDVMGEYIPVGVRELPAEQDLAILSVQHVGVPAPLVQPVVQQVSALAPPTGQAGLTAHAQATDQAFLASQYLLSSANTQTINVVPAGSTPRSTPAAASLATWNGQPAQPASEKLSRKINAPSQHDSMDFVWARFEGLSLDDGLANLVAQGRHPAGPSA